MTLKLRYLYHILILVSLLLARDLYSQSALTNVGANIQIFGSTTTSTQLDLVILGDFENQTDGVGNDGVIDLADNANIYVNQNWLNNSFSNVFIPTSISIIDGTVIFGNMINDQIIGGVSPTYFENINLIGSRKILAVNNNSINKNLVLNAPLILNSNTFEIKNKNNTAIVYQSGYIKSETLPGAHSYIKWNTSNSIGDFSVPFGSDGYSQSADLRLDITLKNPMIIGENILFATYPADGYNLPMPFTSNPLETEIRKVVDRFWLIEPSDLNNIPTMDITFSYAANDIANTKNDINPVALRASRNNTDLGEWLDMKPRGYNFLNRVEIENVLPTEFFPIWTLVNSPYALENLFVPNAFTPDGDGLNETFKPVFQVDYEVLKYEFLIFNRWGRIVFSTKNVDVGWTGKVKGSSFEPKVGVYTWVVIVTGRNIDNIDATGKTQKFTGKVTILL